MPAIAHLSPAPSLESRVQPHSSRQTSGHAQSLPAQVSVQVLPAQSLNPLPSFAALT